MTGLGAVLAAALILAGCSGTTESAGSTLHQQVTPGPLRQMATVRGIRIGSAVDVGTAGMPGALQTESQYRNVLSHEFNIVTPENAMKWTATEPAQGVFDFTASDSLVRFAEQHGIAVRGHNLVWGTDNPAWLTSGSFTRNQLIALLHQHITTVVSHYRGQITQWDVVNEYLNEFGGPDPNIWYEGIGPNYIDMAFRWAHQADPSAKLFYNEDDLAGDPHVLDSAILRLVGRLKSSGVPINGVGIETHTSLSSSPSPTRVAKLMRQLDGLGLDVAITEMDVRLADDHGPTALTRQANVFAQQLSTCLVAPNCHTFVMWGFSDAHSWIPAHFPGFGDALIVDSSYQPKPAYFALQRALSQPG